MDSTSTSTSTSTTTAAAAAAARSSGTTGDEVETGMGTMEIPCSAEGMDGSCSVLQIVDGRSDQREPRRTDKCFLALACLPPTVPCLAERGNLQPY
jgi:hypothetical protein